MLVTHDRPETLKEVLNDLAGRERNPISILSVSSFRRSGSLALSWGLDAARSFRTQLAEEREQIGPRPVTTDLMREAAGDREVSDHLVSMVGDAVDEWDTERSTMIDRRVARAAWTSAKIVGGRALEGAVAAGEALGRTVEPVLERVVDAVFSDADRAAAAASERFDRSISGE